jgi:hypothetical protein
MSGDKEATQISISQSIIFINISDRRNRRAEEMSSGKEIKREGVYVT